ncbi:hypothetical protein HYH02_000021 [Chlamydomonas schloesseri]|uniref:AAA+ ATPase domain-containing protein n=1 Tax=Chlamydomonas schloesseri TaxID=2026947 RepID=A0A836B7M6_9CHLO|nr:hypothetical protein HYH02_000021 [Chlamydomonas schloesseri]|eukprot:KAG2449915.1 hypothetical protein HYH02_000021 [Chlamydomonas schloesseri]
MRKTGFLDRDGNYCRRLLDVRSQILMNERALDCVLHSRQYISLLNASGVLTVVQEHVCLAAQYLKRKPTDAYQLLLKAETRPERIAAMLAQRVHGASRSPPARGFGRSPAAAPWPPPAQLRPVVQQHLAPALGSTTSSSGGARRRNPAAASNAAVALSQLCAALADGGGGGGGPQQLSQLLAAAGPLRLCIGADGRGRAYVPGTEPEEREDRGPAASNMRGAGSTGVAFTDDGGYMLQLLPSSLRSHVRDAARRHAADGASPLVVDVALDEGRPVQVTFADGTKTRLPAGVQVPITEALRALRSFVQAQAERQPWWQQPVQQLLGGGGGGLLAVGSGVGGAGRVGGRRHASPPHADDRLRKRPRLASLVVGGAAAASPGGAAAAAGVGSAAAAATAADDQHQKQITGSCAYGGAGGSRVAGLGGWEDGDEEVEPLDSEEGDEGMGPTAGTAGALEDAAAGHGEQQGQAAEDVGEDGNEDDELGLLDDDDVDDGGWDVGAQPVAGGGGGGRLVRHVEAPLAAWPRAPAAVPFGGLFGSDNRCCPPATLHRISAVREPGSGAVLGLTYRLGRHVPGVAAALADVLTDLAGRGRGRGSVWGRAADDGGAYGGNQQECDAASMAGSLLLLGRPGAGKTTLLRDIARFLADDLGLSVVVVDTSNEIAGGDAVPHSCIGSARRLQVGRRERLQAVMLEAVQNHGPQVVVVDELGSRQEADAARSISQRGVMLVATAHGTDLRSLLSNPDLNSLVGGLQTVILGDAAANAARGGTKTRTERRGEPTFRCLVEVQGRGLLRLRPDVAASVDAMLMSDEDSRGGGGSTSALGASKHRSQAPGRLLLRAGPAGGSSAAEGQPVSQSGERLLPGTLEQLRWGRGSTGAGGSGTAAGSLRGSAAMPNELFVKLLLPTDANKGR